MREVFVIDSVNDFFGRDDAAIGPNVQNVEMKRDILIGAALGFEGLMMKA